jgi:hypothetical protein
MHHLKTLKLKRLNNAASQKNIGVNQQYLGGRGDNLVHARASRAISFSSAMIWTISSPMASSPLM